MRDSHRRYTALLSQVATSPATAEAAGGGVLDVVVEIRDVIAFSFLFPGSLV